ncbi:hypothetical protein CK203_046565 [Vitis vinifera]|uniref:Uncharacterized protein n=1 Tax=Vitis vinifera TaxID=29760 RepID=A0A438HLG2_VITVI|nr:hypothetical protein CK203_046565 [Vitis vinifera]
MLLVRIEDIAISSKVSFVGGCFTPECMALSGEGNIAESLKVFMLEKLTRGEGWG